MQRQRDLRIQRQRGMAAGEHQFQTVIGNRVIHIGFLVVYGQRIHGDRFRCTLLSCCATDAVDEAAPGNRQQPCTGVARNAVDLPAFQRIHQGILERVLRQREISKLADERRQNPPVLFAKGRFDLRCGAHPAYCFSDHNGRISIEPYFAVGIFSAQRIASSRSAHSSTE